MERKQIDRVNIQPFCTDNNKLFPLLSLLKAQSASLIFNMHSKKKKTTGDR